MKGPVHRSPAVLVSITLALVVAVSAQQGNREAPVALPSGPQVIVTADQ